MYARMGWMSASETYVGVAGREVRISSPDRVIFPDRGWTKLDVVQHFVRCGRGALRGVFSRPTMLKRWTKGVAGEPFYVKRAPKNARSTIDVRFPSAQPGRMFLPLDEGDVVWMAQMNCLDLHPWNARADDMEHPDELRIDLDPTEGFDFGHVREVALTVHELLGELRFVDWAKTSGNRGIHIYVRLEPRWDYIEVRRAVLAIAREVERRNDLATTRWWKEEREGVFLDYNQNARDKTVASAYSVRHTGWVSTPFAWEELPAIEPAAFDLETFPARWDAVGDLTEGIDEAVGDLEPALAMVAEDESRGIGDAPWPPHYPKQPGEPPRVQPSRQRRPDEEY
jgi:DNA ligase D-like protein (predicted polymerase)